MLGPRPDTSKSDIAVTARSSAQPTLVVVAGCVTERVMACVAASSPHIDLAMASGVRCSSRLDRAKASAALRVVRRLTPVGFRRGQRLFVAEGW
jgi:hypothetical protein